MEPEHDHTQCQHLLSGLSDYLDGEGSAELCAEIERHLGGCENCRVVVDTLRRTVLLYQKQTSPALPAAARERLYHALDLDAFLTPHHSE